MNYARNLEHPFNHAVILGCGFCDMSQNIRSTIINALPALVRGQALWLQYQPRATSDVINRIHPSACAEARHKWLLRATSDALWDAGYTPDQAYSPDPVWTWGGDLD